MTDALAQSSNKLRAPLVKTLKELARQGDELAKQADSADRATLEQDKQKLDAITAQFKQTSGLAIPLSKQGILLGLYKRSLVDWQSRIRNQYQAELRSLLARLAVLGLSSGSPNSGGERYSATFTTHAAGISFCCCEELSCGSRLPSSSLSLSPMNWDPW